MSGASALAAQRVPAARELRPRERAGAPPTRTRRRSWRNGRPAELVARAQTVVLRPLGAKRLDVTNCGAGHAQPLGPECRGFSEQLAVLPTRSQLDGARRASSCAPSWLGCSGGCPEPAESRSPSDLMWRRWRSCRRSRERRSRIAASSSWTSSPSSTGPAPEALRQPLEDGNDRDSSTALHPSFRAKPLTPSLWLMRIRLREYGSSRLARPYSVVVAPR